MELQELNALRASRKADREKLAEHLIALAQKQGAATERMHTPATPGYCGQGIDLRFTCKGVGAMIDIDDLHGGDRALISWFGTEHKGRTFTARFNTAVGDAHQIRPHHKATSCPADWYSLAMMLEAGLMLAFRGEAFEAIEASAA